MGTRCGGLKLGLVIFRSTENAMVPVKRCHKFLKGKRTGGQTSSCPPPSWSEIGGLLNLLSSVCPSVHPKDPASEPPGRWHMTIVSRLWTLELCIHWFLLVHDPLRFWHINWDNGQCINFRWWCFSLLYVRRNWNNKPFQSDCSSNLRSFCLVSFYETPYFGIFQRIHKKFNILEAIRTTMILSSKWILSESTLSPSFMVNKNFWYTALWPFQLWPLD